MTVFGRGPNRSHTGGHLGGFERGRKGLSRPLGTAACYRVHTTGQTSGMISDHSGMTFIRFRPLMG